MRRWSFVLLLSVGILVASGIFAQGGNLLQDPGFEGEYTNRGRADLNVPAPWGLWFTESPRNEYWQNLPPVAFPHPGPGPNPHGGARAFNFNKGFGTFTAAIYQQVSVPQGENVTGSAFAYLHTCNVPDGFDNCGSAVESGAYVRVGIDPNGGTNPYEADVVWSPSAMPHDRWEQVTVSATSTGTTVTLFLFVTQAWPSSLNSVYWDDASLSIGGVGGAAPAPAAGTAAAPTVPPPPAYVGFVVPQQAQSDGSILHTVQSGDTVDSIAYAYGLTRSQLMALNPGIDPRLIQIGQVLTVREATGESTDEAESTAEPGAASTRRSTPRPTGTAVPTISPIIYYVMPGDTIDSIAFRHGLTRSQLMEYNGITDPRIIQIGQQLYLSPPNGQNPEATPDVSPTPTGTQQASAEVAMVATSLPETAAQPPAENAAETVQTTQTTADAGSEDTGSEGSGAEAATQEPRVAARLSPADAPPAPIVSVASGEVLPAIDPLAGTSSVCAFLFDDENHNRLQEMGEDLLPGGTITLMAGGETLDTYTTDGLNEPFCFGDLDAGEYVVAAAAPDSYGLTTPPQLRVNATAGSDVTVAFGAAQGVEVAALPPADSTASVTADTSGAQTTSGASVANPLTDNLGLIVLGAAGVVLVVGLGASFALRRR